MPYQHEQPDIICFDCLDQLKTAYLIILKYEEATKIISKYLTESLIKHENDSNNEEEIPYKTRNSKTRLKRTRKKTDTAIIQSNNTINLHPCPICTKEFTATELREHAHTHKTLKKYLNIPKQMKVTPTTKFYSKKRETISLFNKNEKCHKCPYCNKEFLVDEFRIHIDLHRLQSEFKCDKCDRVFRQLNHLNTHKIKHLKEYPFKCDECDKGFVIKTNYDCHMLTHQDNELPHECTFCLRRFSNPEHLNRHQLIHTENVSYSVKYKVCRCYQCKKTFKDQTALKQHTCAPIAPLVGSKYSCKSCVKVFKHSSGLYNHNRTIHKLKGTKILCSVCGKHVSNIYHHMMRHNGEKPFKCDQCDKSFIAKPQLKQHLLVHSGEKPFVCSICGKAFNNLYNLQVHERIHKGDRCHMCHVCGKGFLEKSYLKKHMNVHNKNPVEVADFQPDNNV